MQITSSFAILDVKRGQAALANAVEKNRVPIVIKGWAVKADSRDAVSTEFLTDVTSVEIKETPP